MPVHLQPASSSSSSNSQGEVTLRALCGAVPVVAAQQFVAGSINQQFVAGSMHSTKPLPAAAAAADMIAALTFGLCWHRQRYDNAQAHCQPAASFSETAEI
jgi:hypothetical protein